MTVYTLAGTVVVVGFIYAVAWLVGWIADRLAHRGVVEMSREDALRIAARRPLRGEAPSTGADMPRRGSGWPSAGAGEGASAPSPATPCRCATSCCCL